MCLMMNRIVIICLFLIFNANSFPTSNSTGEDSKVVGGSYATEGAYPWQLYLNIETESCGGVLVGPALALTACHCICYEDYMPRTQRPVDKTFGIMGVVDRLLDSDRRQIRHASSMAEHPRCSWKIRPGIPISNDGAAIIFQDPFFLTPTVGTVTPMTMDEWERFQFPQGAYVNCYLSGFGLASYNDRFVSQYLKQIPVYIPSEKECGGYLGCTEDDYSCSQILINDGLSCAGPRTPGTASPGDSGGPYVCDVNGQWLLVGLVSGPIFGRTDIPSLFTSPRGFLPLMNDLLSMSSTQKVAVNHILHRFLIFFNFIKLI